MKKPVLALSAALMSLCLFAQPAQMLSAYAEDEAITTEAPSEDCTSIATAKMTDLNTIIAVLNASPLYTEDTEDENFARITNSRFKNYDDVCDFIKATVSGKLREELLGEAANAVLLVNDKLCVKKTGRSFYQFRTDEGVIITQKTDVTFTATTVTSDELYGMGQAFFILKDGDWYIDFYQFGDFAPVTSDVIGKWIVSTVESENAEALAEYTDVDMTYEFKSDSTGTITASSEGETFTDEVTWEIDGVLVNYTSKKLEDSTYHVKYYSSTNELVLETADGVFVHFARVQDILGDFNGDKKIDAKDASDVLAAYSKISTGEEVCFSWAQKASADANDDGFVDAKDASYILKYYSIVSTDTDYSTSFYFYMHPAGFVTTGGASLHSLSY